MKKYRVYFPIAVVIVTVVLIISTLKPGSQLGVPVTGVSPTAAVKPTRTSTRVVGPTPTHTRTATPTPSPTNTSAAPATDTPSPTGAVTQAITITPDTNPDVIIAYPDAPPCPTHGPALWHGIWDSVRGCHYDHEHGQDPLTIEVANTFPGFDLLDLVGGDIVCPPVPSGPMECTHKAGGLKWNVQLKHPQGCAGFEGAATGVDGSVTEYHAFGNYRMELEAAIHSSIALFRQCQLSNPNDYGYVFVTQHQSYGQVCVPYQGTLFTYPHDTAEPYPCPAGQYITVNCIEFAAPGTVQQFPQCRRDLAMAQRITSVSQSNWSAKITFAGDLGGTIADRPAGSTLFNPFFRIADTPQNFDFRDRSYPYTLVWLCTADNGLTFKPAGCRNNNSTSQMHEFKGFLPLEWDTCTQSPCTGVDQDPRRGRVTLEGFTTAFGELAPECTEVGPGCHPIKLVSAFTGSYGTVLVFTDGKGPNIVPLYIDRDIYFCGQVVCSPTSAGAVPSGWIGEEN